MAPHRPLVLSDPEPGMRRAGGANPVRSSAEYAVLEGPGYDGFLRTGDTAAGVSVTADGAMRVAAVYRCVQILAGAVAGAGPWKLVRTDGDRAEQVHDHHVARLFRRRPNRWQSWFEFMSMLEAHKLLRGNGYALMVRSGSRLVSLIPLHPDRMSPVQLPDLTIVYDYTKPTGQQVRFTQDEILHVRDLTTDGVKGISRLAMMRESLGLTLQAERYGARFFKNDTAIGSAFKMPAGSTLSDDAYSRLKDSLQTKAGADNAHQNIILEEGLDFVRLGLTNEDAQFLQLRQFQRSDLFMFFGVPPFLAGDTEKATSWGTGLEQQGGGFRIYTLDAELNAWKGAFKRDLLTEDEGETLSPTLDASSFQRATAKDQAEVDARSLGSGGHQPWMTVNEIRRSRGLNPIEGGDVLPPRAGADANPIQTTPETNNEPATTA